MPKAAKRSYLPTESSDHHLHLFPFLKDIHISFSRIETLLTFIIGVFIIFFFFVALLGVINDIARPLLITHNFSDATIRGIDAIFLAIILLELFHTIRSQVTLSIQLQEFLIIGITSAVRHGLELAAVSSNGNSQYGIVIDLVVNAVAVFVLVAALWLIRKSSGTI